MRKARSCPASRRRTTAAAAGTMLFLCVVLAHIAVVANGAQAADQAFFLGDAPNKEDASGGDGARRDLRKQQYTVGVLEIRGPGSSQPYNATFSDYLTLTAGKQFDPPIRFEMVPVEFDAVFPFAAKQMVDFMYVNPGLFSCIEVSTMYNVLSFKVGAAPVC